MARKTITPTSRNAWDTSLTVEVEKIDGAIGEGDIVYRLYVNGTETAVIYGDQGWGATSKTWHIIGKAGLVFNSRAAAISFLLGLNRNRNR